ncbi:MAG: hypothetical protein ABIT10_01755 [Alteraurantiacibacter sp.]
MGTAAGAVFGGAVTHRRTAAAAHMVAAACALLLSPPAALAQHRSQPVELPPPDPAALAAGFDGTLLACESWVLDPTSWSGAQGIAPLVELSGLGGRIAPVPSVVDAALPPQEWRVANHYFRIDATRGEGFFLVVSDRVPMCHITGGGINDMRAVVEQVLASPQFAHRWEQVDETTREDMVSTVYRHRLAPQMELVVSRKPAGDPTDLVQVIASAQYRVGE